MKLDIKEGTLTNEGAEIIFTNTTPVAINIEEYYKLQKLEDGQYIELDYIIPYDMIGWEGSMGVVDPGEKLELYVRWADLNGQLEPGDYVLTKHFSEIANTYLYAFHIE